MKRYKVWIEIEELDDKKEPVSGGNIGILPDCIGYFEGKNAKRDALTHMASIIKAHGIDPENSDTVKVVSKGVRTYSFATASEHRRAVNALAEHGLSRVVDFPQEHNVIAVRKGKDAGYARAIILNNGGFKVKKG
jgi:hypothetical protein